MVDKILNFPDEGAQLTSKVIGLAMNVHKVLGPGLLESVYETCLAIELEKAGIRFERQKMMPVKYQDLIIEHAYRLDFVVENALILELKAVEKILPIHQAQIITYMKLSKVQLGLLINFNEKLLKDGIKRMALSTNVSASSASSAVQPASED